MMWLCPSGSYSHSATAPYTRRKVMPNGIYHVPVPLPRPRPREEPSRSGPPRRSAWLRLKTWWRRDRRDEQLAKGADPRANAQLTLRAEQLGSDAERARLAEHLAGILREAGEPVGMTRPLLRRRQVQACAEELFAIVCRLRDGQPIELCGAAMTALLLSNQRGQLYYDRGRVPLREAVRSARLALDENGQSGRRPRHRAAQPARRAS